MDTVIRNVAVKTRYQRVKNKACSTLLKASDVKFIVNRKSLHPLELKWKKNKFKCKLVFIIGTVIVMVLQMFLR